MSFFLVDFRLSDQEMSSNEWRQSSDVQPLGQNNGIWFYVAFLKKMWVFFLEFCRATFCGSKVGYMHFAAVCFHVLRCSNNYLKIDYLSDLRPAISTLQSREENFIKELHLQTTKVNWKITRECDIANWFKFFVFRKKSALKTLWNEEYKLLRCEVKLWLLIKRREIRSPAKPCNNNFFMQNLL